MHGYTQLLLEGQLEVFAQEENLDDFLQRTITATGRRLSRLMRQRCDDGA